MNSILAEIVSIYHHILDGMKGMCDESLLIDKLQKRNAMVEILFSQLNQDDARKFLEIILPLQQQEEQYLLLYRKELNKVSRSINGIRILDQYR